MAIESKWVALRADVIAPATAPQNTKLVTESASPYDVPTHLRSYYDPETGLFTIEFKYISAERVKDERVNPYMTLSLGKKTKRVYAVHLDIHNFERDKKRVAQEARSGIESFLGAKELNRQIASRAIAEKQGTLAAVG